MGKDLKGKELGIGISQQKNGLYSARFVDKYGNRKQKRFKKLQECRQWLADASYADKHSNIAQVSDMTMDAWFDYFIEIKKKTARLNTVQAYAKRYEKHIKPVIGKMLLNDIKPLHCQKIFLDMADMGYKASTFCSTRIVLFSMLELAKDNDILKCNPCTKSVESNMWKSSSKREALTIDAQRKFLECVTGQSYENQFRFLLQTGLRVGELSGLEWRHVDFENRALTIDQSLGYFPKMGGWQLGPPKSQSGYRTIPLTDEAIRILEAQKEKNKRIRQISEKWKEFIFLNQSGNPVFNSMYNQALLSICNKLEIDRFSMHVLRHTFATRCIEAGMRPKTLQRLLGHSSIQMTMNLYVHVTEDEMKKEIDLVAKNLNLI